MVSVTSIISLLFFSLVANAWRFQLFKLNDDDKTVINPTRELKQPWPKAWWDLVRVGNAPAHKNSYEECLNFPLPLPKDGDIFKYRFLPSKQAGALNAFDREQPDVKVECMANLYQDVKCGGAVYLAINENVRDAGRLLKKPATPYPKSIRVTCRK
ncbi:hypothetical protein BZA77DRAFT_387732 [Pyronema omphalodes]|nr:hypothetical protein BZA77DRAFT_387732 [Pyronema omphalodes]